MSDSAWGVADLIARLRGGLINGTPKRVADAADFLERQVRLISDAEIKLQSARWHRVNRTANEGLVIGLEDEAMALLRAALSLRSDPPCRAEKSKDSDDE